MEKKIGITMLALFFVGLFSYFVYRDGFWNTLMAFGISVGMTLFIMVAVYLITNKNK